MMFSNLYVKGIRIKKIDKQCYFKHLPAIKAIMEMDELLFHSNVTFLVGENGIGKSTLIEAIAVAMGFNPEGGSRNFSFSTNDTHSELYDYMTVIKGIRRPTDGFFLRAESLYNAASYIDRVDEEHAKEGLGGIPLKMAFGGISLHKQSHGESFLKVVEKRFGGRGIYILDEPEAALSPSRILQLLCDMKKLVDQDSQFIIATHSPILMAFPGAEVLELTEEGIHSVTYKDTDHYIITKRFLERPEQMLKELFAE